MGACRDLPITRLTPRWREYGSPKLPQINNTLIILEKISYADIVEVDDLDATARGDGGFGSTGVSTTTQ